jgi:alpha-ketoglutarate-dependent taurine dioxygenase
MCTEGPIETKRNRQNRKPQYGDYSYCTTMDAESLYSTVSLRLHGTGSVQTHLVCLNSHSNLREANYRKTATQWEIGSIHVLPRHGATRCADVVLAYLSAKCFEQCPLHSIAAARLDANNRSSQPHDRTHSPHEWKQVHKQGNCLCRWPYGPKHRVLQAGLHLGS